MAAFQFTPYDPHPLISGRHAQTILGAMLPRRYAVPGWRASAQPRIFTMPDGDRLSAFLHRHPDDPPSRRALLVILHGLEGDADAPYVLGLSSKAFAAGFHSLRLNYRGCGGTEHQSIKLYNSAMIEDVDTVLQRLAAEAPWPIVLAGVSLGANKTLRLLGTYGASPPNRVIGGIAISPPIDLSYPAKALSQGFNRVYDRYFLRSIKRKLRRKLALGINPDSDLVCFRQGLSARTLTEYDEWVTAPLAGQPDAESYYRMASTLDLLGEIRVPTLMIHAEDDPLISMDAFQARTDLLRDNPCLTVYFTKRGGHVGFMQAPHAPRTEPWMDSYWAENTAIQYLEWLSR